jgi:hypothetical protein
MIPDNSESFYYFYLKPKKQEIQIKLIIFSYIILEDTESFSVSKSLKLVFDHFKPSFFAISN